jgi:hypothetical protein
VQKPNPALEPKVARRQRSDRADVRDVPGVGIQEGAIFKRAYHHMVTASEELQLAGTSDVIEETDASRTEHAPLLIEDHHRSEV